MDQQIGKEIGKSKFEQRTLTKNGPPNFGSFVVYSVNDCVVRFSRVADPQGDDGTSSVRSWRTDVKADRVSPYGVEKKDVGVSEEGPNI